MGRGGKVAQKTKSRHKVKCALRPKGSIFEGPPADHGAIILGIWRWAQKVSPAEVAANIGLFPPVITDFYRAMRFAAMRGEYGFGGSGVAGGAKAVLR